MRKASLRMVGAVIASWLGIFAAATTEAGVLILNNGDRISGELIIIADGDLRWQSDMAGELLVPQTNVKSVEASDEFEVELDERRSLTACRLQMRGQQQLLNCRHGIVEVGSWKTVARVSARPLQKKDQWRSNGDVSVALRDSAGNNEQRGISLDVRSSWRRADKRHTLRADYQSQRDRDIKTADSRGFDYQFDKFVSEKWFLRATLGWERDRFQNLESRGLYGGGVGYQFVDTELMRLAVEGGLAYVTEQYDADPNRESLALRGNTDFSVRINRFGLQFFHRNTVLQMLENGGDWRLRSETGFRLPIIDRLSAQAKLKFDYTNVPAGGADSLDRTWTFGVNYGWW